MSSRRRSGPVRPKPDATFDARRFNIGLEIRLDRMQLEPPLVWSVTDASRREVGSARWTGGMAVVVEAEPRTAAYLEDCVARIFALLRATGSDDSDTGMIGGMLDAFFSEQLVAVSTGALRGARAVTAADLAPPDLTPTDLAQATRDGRITWTAGADGASFASPGLRLARRGREHTLVATRGGVDAPPIVQKNGIFGGRCELGALWDAIEATRAQAPAVAQWAPSGATPSSLTEPVTEPRAREHLASGRVVARARFGPYHVVVVDVTGAPSVAIRYSFRAFVLPAPDAAPVLAVNHEVSLFGTACFGVHRGGLHVAYGEAAAAVSYEVFEAQAKAILAEELLGRGGA